MDFDSGNDRPSLGPVCDSVSGWIRTKFSVSLSLQGYMTIRRSSPYHMDKLSMLCSTKGLVTGSSSATLRGRRKRNAALPEPNNRVSGLSRTFLVLDCFSILVWGPHRAFPRVAHIDAIGPKNEICLHRTAVTEGDLAGACID